MKISIGWVNCNRLHYLKSSINSFLECSKDFSGELELLAIDNASIEDGTEEFLKVLEKKNFKVFRQPIRQPENEFAIAINKITKESTGDIVGVLQGDMQFILKGRWLEEIINLFSSRDDIGFLMLDAQRKERNSHGNYSQPIGNDFKFIIDYTRNKICGAGDGFFSREVLDKIYPWAENNQAHEGGMDSETNMLHKIKRLEGADEHIKKLKCYMSIVPISATIYNTQGTNARVRKNKRYGEYLPPQKGDWKYYKVLETEEQIKKFSERKNPVGFEEIVQPIGFDVLKDGYGNMIKKSIRPETATPDQYEVLYDENNIIESNENWLEEWVDE